MPAASSRLSRKGNNEGEGNLSSPSSARASGSKKKKVDSPAASKKKAVITSTAATPAPVVAPTPVIAPAPVLRPVVEPAEKKKAVTPTTAAAPAPAPVVESPSKSSKGSGIVAVGSHALVVSVAPSVETAPQKQANVADAVKAPDEDDSVDTSEAESEDAGDQDISEDNSSESSDSEDSEDEDDADPRSDELLEEVEKTKDEGVLHEVAVQGGIAHGKVDRVVVSFNCICILFCIPVTVM
jgi:hypothetical protein